MIWLFNVPWPGTLLLPGPGEPFDGPFVLIFELP